MKIRQANSFDIESVARLFDLYRQFYECPPDLDTARTFIRNRMMNGDSTIFIAEDAEQQIAGFTQLYPSYCSVDAIRILILYDLFVDSAFRKKGVGEMLMNRATKYARESGAGRLDLLTAKDNLAGQHLYEKLGYQKANEGFFAYSLYP